MNIFSAVVKILKQYFNSVELGVWVEGECVGGELVCVSGGGLRMYSMLSNVNYSQLTK